jgi:hypothetical protein
VALEVILALSTQVVVVVVVVVAAVAVVVVVVVVKFELFLWFINKALCHEDMSFFT